MHSLLNAVLGTDDGHHLGGITHGRHLDLGRRVVLQLLELLALLTQQELVMLLRDGQVVLVLHNKRQ